MTKRLRKRAVRSGRPLLYHDRYGVVEVIGKGVASDPWLRGQEVLLVIPLDPVVVSVSAIGMVNPDEETKIPGEVAQAIHAASTGENPPRVEVIEVLPCEVLPLHLAERMASARAELDPRVVEVPEHRILRRPRPIVEPWRRVRFENRRLLAKAITVLEQAGVNLDRAKRPDGIVSVFWAPGGLLVPPGHIPGPDDPPVQVSEAVLFPIEAEGRLLVTVEDDEGVRRAGVVLVVKTPHGLQAILPPRRRVYRWFFQEPRKSRRPTSPPQAEERPNEPPLDPEELEKELARAERRQRDLPLQARWVRVYQVWLLFCHAVSRLEYLAEQRAAR